MTTISKLSDISLFSKELSNVDDIDLTLIIATLAAVQTELVHLDRRSDALLYLAKREDINRKHYLKRRERVRTERQLQLLYGDEEEAEESESKKSKFPSWSELSDGVSDLIFRRKYTHFLLPRRGGIAKINYETIFVQFCHCFLCEKYGTLGIYDLTARLWLLQRLKLQGKITWFLQEF